jgi:hypothetical protein
MCENKCPSASFGTICFQPFFLWDEYYNNTGEEASEIKYRSFFCSELCLRSFCTAQNHCAFGRRTPPGILKSMNTTFQKLDCLHPQLRGEHTYSLEYLRKSWPLSLLLIMIDVNFLWGNQEIRRLSPFTWTWKHVQFSKLCDLDLFRTPGSRKSIEKHTLWVLCTIIGTLSVALVLVKNSVKNGLVCLRDAARINETAHCNNNKFDWRSDLTCYDVFKLSKPQGWLSNFKPHLMIRIMACERLICQRGLWKWTPDRWI